MLAFRHCFYFFQHVIFCCLIAGSAWLSNVAHAATPLVNIGQHEIKAAAWVILDADSGQILAQHNAQQQRAPASLTKMMVAYIALKQIQQGKLTLEQQLTVPEAVNTVASDESRMFLKAGQQLSVQDLLTGLLVTSANDAAITLATHIAGDVPRFVELMNTAVQQLQLNHTQFANVSGITQDGHYTTARDIAMLSRAIIQQCPHYTEFSKLQHFSHGSFSGDASNHLLKQDPTVDGMKTGYTRAAGYNLVATAQRVQDNTTRPRRIFAAVLGSTSKYNRTNDAKILLNQAYQQTRNIELLQPQQALAKLPVWQAEDRYITVLSPRALYLTVKTSTAAASTAQAHVDYQLDFNPIPLTAPIKAQQPVGVLTIHYQHKPISTIVLKTSQDVAPAGFFKRQWDKISFFFSELFNKIARPQRLV